MKKTMNQIVNHKTILPLGVILALVFFSSMAKAETIRMTRTNSTPVISDTPRVLQSGWFFTSKPNSRVVVTYNAECTVSGPNGNHFNWLNIDIRIDGQLVRPTESDNALCTSNGTPGLDGWVSAVSMGVVRVPKAGFHFLQVRANDQQAGRSFRIDDQVLLVESQP
ncbi:MAG: hypothetical protein ACE5F7_00650 [Nitrospiria bacterium]